MAFDIRNERMGDDEFFERRKEVLKQWETGKQVADLNENIAVARELSRGKSYALTLAEHKKNGANVFEPQFGQALTEYMIEGLTYVEANSDLYPHGVWTIFSDTYTRKADFARAAAGIERSRKEGMNMLNGWPVVCFGVEEARKIMKAVKCPLNLNSADEVAGLQTEIVFAAGWNGGNNNPIMTCVAHSKDIPMDKLLKIKQYDARLGGIYTENGSSHLSAQHQQSHGLRHSRHESIYQRGTGPLRRSAGHQIPASGSRSWNEYHPGCGHGAG